MRIASGLLICCLVGCASGGGADPACVGVDCEPAKTTPSEPGVGREPANDADPTEVDVDQIRVRPRRDASTPVVDSGTVTADSGTRVDSGTPRVDSGTPPVVVDASTPPVVDASKPPVVDAGTPVASTGQWVLGYYVGYQINQYPVASIDWSGLTHIAMAPLVVRSNRSFDTTFFNFGSDADGKTFAKQLSAAAHANGVKALLMLGGAGASDQVKPWLTGDKNGFVTALLALMRELGYDGIDLDVEASNFSLDDFITLASALRAAAPNVVLSYPGATVPFGTQVDARVPRLATYLDRVNIQSYQGGSAGMFTGSNGAGQRFESWFYSSLGGISALRMFSIDYALQQLAAAGVPKAKLGMGAAFYAGCYKIPDTTPPGGPDVSAPRMSTNSGSDWCWDCGVGGGDGRYSLNKFFAPGSVFASSTSAEQKFDTTAQEPYLSFAAAKQDDLCGGRTRYVVYEDERSLIAKGAFSRQQGYGGIIIWTIQQGYLPANAVGGRARNALMQALRKGFIAP